MTTLWEMAATVRAEEVQVQESTRVAPCAPHVIRRDVVRGNSERPIDLRERGHMDYWCKSLGATRMQLYRAVAHVGPCPSAVRRFLSARFLPGKIHA